MARSGQAWSMLGGLVAAAMGGCDARPSQRVSEVRQAFAAQAKGQDIPFGTSGTLRAREVDLDTMQLLDVRFDNGDELLMYAERAEIVVSASEDTMMLRFFNVTAVMPATGEGTGDGVIREEAVLTSAPWDLEIDVIPD